MRVVRDEALSGAVPPAIERYLVGQDQNDVLQEVLERQNRERNRRRRRYDREGLTEEAADRLTAEAEQVKIRIMRSARFFF